MTKKEIDTLMQRGNSHSLRIDGLPLGITRIQVFLAIKPLLKRNLYWYALRHAYDCSDNFLAYKTDIQIAFTAEVPCKYALMTPDERKFLNKLPEQITIYRGMTNKELESKEFGISWSLKEDIAYFFAKKNIRNLDTNHLTKTVHQLKISKSEVIAYFNERKEFEIIYIPKEILNSGILKSINSKKGGNN